MKRRVFDRCVAIAILVLPFLIAGDSIVFSQQNPNAPQKELPVRELLRLPGKLVSEATTSGSNNQIRLTGYRVEELQLPRSLNVELRGQQVAVEKAWRVTVQGGPFPVRALPAVIWIDDQIVGNGVENETLSQISAITFDSSLVREGGVVSISYGEDKDARVRLTQKLQLKRQGENQ